MPVVPLPPYLLGMRLPDLESLSAVEVAALLGVTDRAVRKWVQEKDLPCIEGLGIKTFSWPAILAWREKAIREDAGRRGTSGKFSPGTAPPADSESYEDALARKTRAEADLKELQLAKERGQVAAIGDVEKVLAASTKATQTQILALPSRLGPRILGIEDLARAVAIVKSEVAGLLSNLATIDAIREASGIDGGDEE